LRIHYGTLAGYSKSLNKKSNLILFPPEAFSFETVKTDEAVREGGFHGAKFA
jgi:hypothetical protein